MNNDKLPCIQFREQSCHTDHTAEHSWAEQVFWGFSCKKNWHLWSRVTLNSSGLTSGLSTGRRSTYLQLECKFCFFHRQSWPPIKHTCHLPYTLSHVQWPELSEIWILSSAAFCSWAQRTAPQSNMVVIRSRLISRLLVPCGLETLVYSLLNHNTALQNTHSSANSAKFY